MSAWIVTKKHLDYILTSYLNLHGVDPSTLSELGQNLWNENFKSVNHRYQESEVAPEYEFTAIPGICRYAAIKAISCLNYQSCEHEEWEKSLEKSFLTQLKTELSETLINEAPQYIAAPWGID